MSKKDRLIRRLINELQEANFKIVRLITKQNAIFAKECVANVNEYANKLMNERGLVKKEEIAKILDVHYVDSVKLQRMSIKKDSHNSITYFIEYSTATYKQEREFTKDEYTVLMAYYNNLTTKNSNI